MIDKLNNKSIKNKHHQGFGTTLVVVGNSYASIFINLFLFQPFFVERVFHIFDKDDNGSISLQEFLDAMHQFAGQSPDDKIKFLFKVYDIDGKT